MAISFQFDEMCSKYGSKSWNLGLVSSQWWESIKNVFFNKPMVGFVGTKRERLNEIRAEQYCQNFRYHVWSIFF